MKKTLIIAEAGVNHNGDVSVAKKLVQAAKESGADIVKFQTFNVDSMVTSGAEIAEYQKKNMVTVENQKELLSRLSLQRNEFIELVEYCKKLGITFLSSPFDIDSIHFLNDVQDIWKIPSGEITNYPYLVEIGKTQKPIILSTGMSTLEEVDAAIGILKENGAGNITLMQCTTNYPTSYKDVNLNAMLAMKKHSGCEVGYSDHTIGIEIPVAAVAIGATVIEKHFTLNRNMEGPDHKASLEPNELKAMVESIRHIEIAMGDGIKQPIEAEMDNIKVARKSIVAARSISVDEVFSEDNLTTKRPGIGISPMRWNELIGVKSNRDYEKDELIDI